MESYAQYYGVGLIKLNGSTRLVHSGWSHSLGHARANATVQAGGAVWQRRGGSAQMDRTKSILVGLVSTSSCLDWTWLASNQVQMDLV